MTAAQMRNDLKRRLDQLPVTALGSVVDFVNYLEFRSLDPATRELMNIPGLASRISAAERQVRQGKTRNWRKVRADVHR